MTPTPTAINATTMPVNPTSLIEIGMEVVLPAAPSEVAELAPSLVVDGLPEET